jgi:hypothetical protein
LVYKFLSEYRYKRLKFAQLLGQLGAFLTFWFVSAHAQVGPSWCS